MPIVVGPPTINRTTALFLVCNFVVRFVKLFTIRAYMAVFQTFDV